MLKPLIIALLTTSLIACANTPHSLYTTSELQQGKRYFEEGYYKRAAHQLLPLACDGNPEAQYAIGYQYYYGYGLAQDTDVGYFWIKRAADQGYEPAKRALITMQQEKEKRFKPKVWQE